MPANYIPEIKLTIDGALASTALMEDILQVSVEESLHLPSMFTIVVKNDFLSGRDADTPWKHESLFTIGAQIKINFTSSTTGSNPTANQGDVIDGEITAIEVEFTEKSQAPIIIRGYDKSHRLHRGRYNRSFQNMTDSDIVTQIAQEAGLTATVDATGGPYGYGSDDPMGYVFQENQTNMEFLQERAAINGFELFVQSNKLYFRKPSSAGSITLTWLLNLFSFSVRVSASDQVSSVQVRAWNYQTKQALIGNKTTSSTSVITSNDYGKGTAKATAFTGSPTAIIVDRPMFAQAQVDNIAQSLLDELGGEYVFADAKADGNPLICPGKTIALASLGKYSGSYYVTETRHLLSAGRYVTEFSVRGLRGGDLLSAISSQTKLKPSQTLLVGIVTDNNDPNGWGRVRVKFPTLAEDHASYWARVATIGAGASRGFDCLPEVNDEVLVGFEHGDIHRPYVIGSVWNGKDAPPTAVADSIVDGKVRLRTFKTRVGHQLQFVEEDKGTTKKGVYLNTIDGHNLRMNDSEKFAELETTGGHKFRADDSSNVISLTSSGDITVKTGTSGSTKDLTVNAANITLTATANITLKVGSNKIEISNSGIVIDGIQVQIKGTSSAEVKAPMITVEGSATNTVKGGIVSVEASGVAVLKGSLVKIN